LLGGIQPHGVLLAFRAAGPHRGRGERQRRTRSSASRPQALLGQPITRVLDADTPAPRARRGPSSGPVRVVVAGRPCSALLHDSDGLAV
ncbi:histidine kinase, partial [Pyxidicoccus sp. 3LG]